MYKDILLSSSAEPCKEIQILVVVTLSVSSTETSGLSRLSVAPVAQRVSGSKRKKQLISLNSLEHYKFPNYEQISLLLLSI